MTIKPSDYRELAELAHEAGFRLRITASTNERFVMERRHDYIIVCTFSDLDAVRDWLEG